MWEIDLSGQIYTMLLSIAIGTIYGLLFDFHSVLCVGLKSKVSAFLLDLLFFLMLSVFEFCFFLARCSGEIRGYVFVCQIIGFCIYKKTVSWLICLALQWIRSSARKAFSALSSLIFTPMSLFLHKIFKKSRFFSKKG